MYCQNRIVHTIEQGDSLYRLARQYDTTVTELILGNPGANPYNLQVGMKLQICPGPDYDGPLPNTPGVVIPILPGDPNRQGIWCAEYAGNEYARYAGDAGRK